MCDRPSLISFVAVALLVYSLCSLAAASLKLDSAEKDLAALEEEYALLVSEQETLTARLESGLSDDELERLARERLGLVMPGEKIFYFSER